jgi:dihydroorotate dehydrogenase electron transfer subunit
MNYDNDVLSILFKRKGEGTAYISSLCIGDTIDFTGPFGNGFSINNKKSLLIGGGVGSAPLYFLKKYLSKKGIENFLMAGFQTVADIPEKMDIDFISTDDGSFKHKGFICDYLEEVIENYSPQVIYACGPFLLLKKIHLISKQYGIPLYVAMEKEMACSIGVCRGCVIELSNGQNATVCKDGPVFLSEAIKWD